MHARHYLAVGLMVLIFPLSVHGAPSDGEMMAINAARADYQTARSAIQREDWREALSALRRAERLDPRSADVQNLLGFVLRQQGSVDAAIPHYVRALELNPSHRGAHEYLGRAYLYQGKPEAAKEMLAKLESLCATGCAERESLRQAIAEWDPWKRPARGGRSY